MSRWNWVWGPTLGLLVWLSPLALEAPAKKLAGLLLWVVAWWVLEILPLSMTGFFGIAGLVALGITDLPTAFSGYGHPIIFLFLGGFLLAKSMSVHRLDQRIALYALTRKFVAGRPLRVLLTLILVTAGLSMWISNTATTAMMLPISLGILTAVFPRQTRTQATVLIAVAYASSIGGIATPVGSTPNIIGLGILEQEVGTRFTFFEWMRMTLPTMFACLAGLFALLIWRLPKLPDKIPVGFLFKEYKQLTRLRGAELNTIAAVLVAVLLWTGPGILAIVLGSDHSTVQFLKDRLPEPVSAMLAACMLFFLPHGPQHQPTLTWKDAATIDWNALLLFGAGLSLGKQLFETGLAPIVGSGLLALTGGQFWILVGLLIVSGILFTEVVSNTATANMMIPLAISIAIASGHSPIIPVIAVSIACSLAFMMPVSTPPNAIIFGSGKIKIQDMLRFGWKMNLLCAAIVFGSMQLLSFWI